jgi:hypothetical protein
MKINEHKKACKKNANAKGTCLTFKFYPPLKHNGRCTSCEGWKHFGIFGEEKCIVKAKA